MTNSFSDLIDIFKEKYSSGSVNCRLLKGGDCCFCYYDRDIDSSLFEITVPYEYLSTSDLILMKQSSNVSMYQDIRRIDADDSVSISHYISMISHPEFDHYTLIRLMHKEKPAITVRLNHDTKQITVINIKRPVDQEFYNLLKIVIDFLRDCHETEYKNNCKYDALAML